MLTDVAQKNKTKQQTTATTTNKKPNKSLTSLTKNPGQKEPRNTEQIHKTDKHKETKSVTFSQLCQQRLSGESGRPHLPGC